jgi:hypothetical protein
MIGLKRLGNSIVTEKRTIKISPSIAPIATRMKRINTNEHGQ